MYWLYELYQTRLIAIDVGVDDSVIVNVPRVCTVLIGIDIGTDIVAANRTCNNGLASD